MDVAELRVSALQLGAAVEEVANEVAVEIKLEIK
tara:strand:- start:417 stop:518 length:102 start_codon:yes stop_codon:yes gene_type:complete